MASCSGASGASVEWRVNGLVWGGEQELVASDAAELDNFGWSVALTADRALVGAYGESNYRGAAYVSVKRGNEWIEEQKLVASDGVDVDRFGTSVALVGDRALIGAYSADSSRGAAYVFVRNGDSWTEEQKLVASDGAAGDNFGWSVALTEDRVLVGAYGRDTARGAAYVFVRGSSSPEHPWIEEQKLVVTGGVAEDYFGWSVALAESGGGGRALVGAPGAAGYRGAAHVFVRSASAPAGSWAEEQTLVASDGAALDNFGTSVSVIADPAGDRALVGAYWNADLRGAAYVYLRTDGAAGPSWTEEQKLVASDGADGDRLGNAVSLATDRALIGASGLGAAYVFARSGSTWSQEARLLAGEEPTFNLFGWSVAFAADQALIGASYTDQLRGAAYVFSLGVVETDGGAGDAIAADAGTTDAGSADAQDAGSIEAGFPDPGSCTRADECASGHCEDGICCDRTCSASERCRAALKVSGDDSTCGPAVVAVLGAPCTFDVQCTSGHCAVGVCSEATSPPDAACVTGDTCAKAPVGNPAIDDSGCGCRIGRVPARRSHALVSMVLALLLVVRRRSSLASRGKRAGENGLRFALAVLLACAVVLGGCIGRPSASNGGRGGGPVGGAGTGGQAGGGGMASDSPFLPARVRRLTNAEYAASVFALLGVDSSAAVTGFPRDATQKLGFTVNDAQIVSSVLASQLDSSAQTMVAAARQVGQFDLLAPCSDPSTDGETCARSYIQSFGARAYRRPLTTEEVDPLMAVYRSSAGDGGTHDDGIDFVTRAILQAPSFIYVTELGDGTAGSAAGTTQLTPYEIAGLLSYVVTAGPPDKTLLETLDALATADGREQQLRRLLPDPGARMRWVRVVREWLGIDSVEEIDKDSNVYPSFAAHHSAIAAETASFIDEVLTNGTGTLQELLGADWTIIDSTKGATVDEIAAYYTGYYGLADDGSPRDARVGLSRATGGTRVGILNQGGFLARFATATASHPVLRGVAVMRRLACLELADPSDLDITVIPPVPDPNTPKTTRALYAAHSTDPVCKSCHRQIDNFGFAFEQYDGMGVFRDEETVRTAAGIVMLPVDSKTTLAGTGTDLDGDYADSNALARVLSTSLTARECMARQMFRAATGRDDASMRGAEDSFVREWRQLPADRQSSLIDTLVALVRSDVFIERSAGQ